MRDVLEDKKKDYRMIKISLSLFTSMSSLYLIPGAFMSVRSTLDKPIPTGSINELIAYASQPLIFAALIVCAALSIFLSVKYTLHIQAEHRAKVMSVELIKRISAMANQKEAKESTSRLHINFHS
jgi:TRAP-type C4-dicarboxylate transport system permease small subunit